MSGDKDSSGGDKTNGGEGKDVKDTLRDEHNKDPDAFDRKWGTGGNDDSGNDSGSGGYKGQH